MYKTKARPNKKDVAQLLDLEFQSRRAFIDSDVTKEQDRPVKILEAYPCFGELDNLMDELRRILDQGNPHFLPELNTRRATFFERAQFYGVFKKVMRPPLLDKAQQSIALMKALPDLFPSPVAPPKKLGHASEALLHILKVRKCICIRIFTFTLPYNTKSALWYFFFFLCLSAYRRPQHHSTSKTTLQPGRCCQ
ncbi:unnamed protein product [Gadus morhua 'NCC']